MDATALATLWATISLAILVGIFIYMKVPAMVNDTLDKRADRIRNELDEARKLREEAQQLLAEYQRKRQEAEKEAGDIVAAAEREAKLMADEARQRSEDYVTRRSALAEQKIARAEQDAVAEVRARAVDIAVEAAGRVLADKVDAKADASLFKAALADVRTRLN
jgi:F-type H+-transporting ATPase subunit b